MDVLTIATGDIVASSRLPDEGLERAMAALEEASRLVWRWRSQRHPPEFVRFRGDSWQAALPEPEIALRAALFFRAHVRRLGQSYDTRISIGIGPGGLAQGERLGASGGPAFEASGRGLDTMPRAARFAFRDAGDRAGRSHLPAIFALADEISRRWTVKQAEVFARMLPPDSGPQKITAEALGISQQMVAKHLRTGGDWALQRAITALEAGHDRH